MNPGFLKNQSKIRLIKARETMISSFRIVPSSSNLFDKISSILEFFEFSNEEQPRNHKFINKTSIRNKDRDTRKQLDIHSA